ncbi:MAG: hypothetical protein JSS26_08380 [Nitrospira sp.]|nr:hypothetical protein [Nitrospira sp.]
MNGLVRGIVERQLTERLTEAVRLAGVMIQPEDRGQLMLPSEAARVLGLRTNEVRGLAEAGILPGLRTIGGDRVFMEADVRRAADGLTKALGPSRQ